MFPGCRPRERPRYCGRRATRTLTSAARSGTGSCPQGKAPDAYPESTSRDVEESLTAHETLSRRSEKPAPSRATSAMVRGSMAKARPTHPASPAQALALQHAAGNAAVASLLRASSQGPTVSRCGPTNPDCGCPDEQEAQGSAGVVQRNDSFDSFKKAPPGDPFGLPGPPVLKDRLRFSNRSFIDESLPTVCPRCHQQTPTVPMPPKYVDQDATEPRLVTWGTESEKMLHHDGTTRIIQLDPNGFDTIVDDYGVGLTKRITSTHEFQGPDDLRDEGAGDGTPSLDRHSRTSAGEAAGLASAGARDGDRDDAQGGEPRPETRAPQGRAGVQRAQEGLPRSDGRLRQGWGAVRRLRHRRHQRLEHLLPPPRPAGMALRDRTHRVHQARPIPGGGDAPGLSRTLGGSSSSRPTCSRPVRSLSGSPGVSP